MIADLPTWAKGICAIIAALAAGIVTVSVTGIFDDDCEDCAHPPQVTASFPGVVPDADKEIDRGDLAEQGARPLTADPTAPSLANVGPEIAEDMRDETPPGVTPQEAADAEIEAPGIGEPQPPAGAQNYSCTPHYVVNQSPLSGARSGVALHFTVSSPGSMQAIWRLFNTPSFGASSNFGIELDGECEIWVAVTRKGWAQGAFNSAYISIEIVTNDLSRAQWLASPIIRDGILASLVADLLRRVGAPPRLVDPVGCSPLAGVTDHNRLECGNTHWDVGSGFPWDVFMAQVKRAYGGGSPVCGERCKALKARHAAAHKRYRARGCKRTMHERKASELNRRECRKVKRLGHEQHRKLHKRFGL